MRTTEQHPEGLKRGEAVGGHLLVVGRYYTACEGGRCALIMPNGAERIAAMAAYVDKVTVIGTLKSFRCRDPLIELPDNVSCLSLPPMPWYLLLWPLTVLKVALCARRADFVRLRLSGYVGCLGYLGARIAGKPVYFYIGGPAGQSALTSPHLSRLPALKRIRATIDDWLVRRVVRNKLVVCSDERLAEQLRPYAGRSHGFKMSNLLLPDDFVDPETIDCKWDKPVKVLVVATLNPGKGIQELIRALADLKQAGHDVVLRSAGDGPYRSELASLANKLGLSEDGVFLGRLGRADLRAEYRQADIFCLPSHSEGSPMVIPEAMAAGLPVVATDVGNVTNIIDHGRNGLVCQPQDVAGLTAALASLLDDPDLATSMARAGRHSVEDIGLHADTREFMGIVASHLNLPIVVRSGHRN